MRKRPYTQKTRAFIVICTVILPIFILSFFPLVAPLTADSSQFLQGNGTCARISLEQGRHRTTGAGIEGTYKLLQHEADWILGTWDGQPTEGNHSARIENIPVPNDKEFEVDVFFYPLAALIPPIQLEIINEPYIQRGQRSDGCPSIEVEFPDDWNPNNNTPSQINTLIPSQTTPLTPSQTTSFTPLAEAVWETVEGGETPDLAWGDINKDGFLDLVAAEKNENDLAKSRNRLFLNHNGQLNEAPDWLGEENLSNAIALADFNNDGYLDLAVGNEGANKVYFNEDGVLEETASWHSDDTAVTTAIVIGDVNGDGRFDIIAGNADGPDIVYINTFDPNAEKPVYFEEGGIIPDTENTSTTDLAIGLLNDDQKLDLIIASEKTITLFEAADDSFVKHSECDTENAFGLHPDAHVKTTVIELGDLDGDGNVRLDLAVLTEGYVADNQQKGSNLYILTDIFESLLSCDKQKITIGTTIFNNVELSLVDANGDGALDISTGTDLFLHTGSFFENRPLFTKNLELSILTNYRRRQTYNEAHAWADIDGDGDLDVVVTGKDQPIHLHINDSQLYNNVANSPTLNEPQQYSWADINNDGFYDYVKAFADNSYFVGLGTAEGIGESESQYWALEAISPGNLFPYSRVIAWADINEDNFLDFAISTLSEGTRLFVNKGDDSGTFDVKHLWENLEGKSSSLAWGDVNNDGKPDLAIGNLSSNSMVTGGADLLFLFDEKKGTLSTKPDWISADKTSTLVLQWEDVDDDGDIDLVSQDEFGQLSRIYINENGSLQEEAIISKPRIFPSNDIMDINGDGQNDIFVNSDPQLFSHFPTHPSYPGKESLSIRLLEPGKLAPAPKYARPNYIEDGYVSFEYSISGPSERLYDVFGFYSIDGGVNWQAAIPTAVTDTQKLDIQKADSFTYKWDVFNSNVFGVIDDTRFRLQVRPYFAPKQANSVPGIYQRPFAQTETLPFRIQGKQLKVICTDCSTADDSPTNSAGAEQAIVFHRTDEQAKQAIPAKVLRNAIGIPYDTDDQGILAGRTILNLGDQLAALWPVPAAQIKTKYPDFDFTNQYTLLHSSGSPTNNGLEFNVYNPDKATNLTVTNKHPLLLFNLSVSLEWDARNDTLFLLEVEESFKEASALLYDVSNGQVVLGRIDLFHEKANWGHSDIVIFADNSLRPTAAIGGIVNHPIDDIDISGETIKRAYLPGQIRMGTVWDPYGERTADLGEDWTRALAHELAHYLLFLPDNYLGYKGANNDKLGRINCPGSFMTSTSDPSYSEFLTQTEWNRDENNPLEPCERTLANRVTGRSDWETIRKYYPMLITPTAMLPGPSVMPLEVTYLVPWAAQDQELPLAARNFDVRVNNDTQDRLRLPDAQAYLFKTNVKEDPTDDALIALGSPTGGGDRLKVRGAEVGDRLCIFDTNGATAYAGCIDSLTTEIVNVKPAPVWPDLAWQPEIIAHSETAHAINITMTQKVTNGQKAWVQIYPLHYGSVPNNAPLAEMSTVGDVHTATLTMALPAYEIAVRVWVENDEICAAQVNKSTNNNNEDFTCLREAITAFRLNPPWEPDDLPDIESPGGDENFMYFTPIGNPDSSAIGGGYNVLTFNPDSSAIGGGSIVLTFNPDSSAIGGGQQLLTFNPDSSAIGGGYSVLTFNPDSSAIGGGLPVAIFNPDSSAIGGGTTVLTFNPDSSAIGGGNNIVVFNPDSSAIGGGSRTLNAPILSADAQVAIYNKASFFADNGVESLQALAAVPQIDAHPWLVPVGQAYRVVLDESEMERFISFTYLQREVPDGYEQTLNIYFLPDCPQESPNCATTWERLSESEQFVENLIVADLKKEDGSYAVMSTYKMPPLEPGWNLMAYAMPDRRCVFENDHCAYLNEEKKVEEQCLDNALASISSQINDLRPFDALSLAEVTEDSSVVPVVGAIEVTMFEPGEVYWIHITGNETVQPYFAVPERRSDGTLPCSG